MLSYTWWYLCAGLFLVAWLVVRHVRKGIELTAMLLMRCGYSSHEARMMAWRSLGQSELYQARRGLEQQLELLLRRGSRLADQLQSVDLPPDTSSFRAIARQVSVQCAEIAAGRRDAGESLDTWRRSVHDSFIEIDGRTDLPERLQTSLCIWRSDAVATVWAAKTLAALFRSRGMEPYLSVQDRG